ncbi:hypothetical protein EVA_15056 [gut metagenome]|uniref:Uncharacterized protein n=1 Tax=gut metagenome TaxID=749906 RepID=J9FPF8_9ZZZZ
MKKIIKIFFVYHDRCSGQKEYSIRLIHNNLSSFIGLSFSIAHLMRFIAKYKTETLWILRKVIH